MGYHCNMEFPTIVYQVDAEDRIVSVNDAWDIFAAQNDGNSATAERVVGRNLFEFISDPSTQYIYKQVLARIRSGSPFRFVFRCDSPIYRRLMQMEMQASDDRGSVEFRSTTLDATLRPAVQIPQADGADAPQPQELQRVCGWCNRLDVNGTWLEIEQALPLLQMMEVATAPMVTHAMCDECMQRMVAEMETSTRA